MNVLFKAACKTRENKWLLVAIICSMCLATVASQLEIFSIGLITQKGQNETGSGWIAEAFAFVNRTFAVYDHLGHLALFLVLVATFKALTMFSTRYLTKLASIRISAQLRQEYFEHIQTLPMSFYQRYNMGSLSSRVVGDAALVADALNAYLINYLQTPFTVISTLIICFLTSWQLTLIIFIGFPLILWPISFLAKGVKRVSKQIQSTQEKFASVLLDFIGGIQTIKIFGMERFSLEKYREFNEKMATLEKKSARYDLSTRPIVHTLAMVFLSTALVYGLYVLEMEVSQLLFYCGMLYLFYEPIKKFAEENSHIQRGVAAAERMLEVMALKPEIEDHQHAEALKSFEQQIEFDQVSFKYGDEWVLKGVSFVVNKGEKVAIVGPTGSGKSTIVQLLPRLYEPQKGEIRIDGSPLSAYTQSSIRELIAFVPQRPFLFIDTILNNIAFGRPSSIEMIQDAAAKAHAAEFVEQLSHKYDAEVQEGGKNFSGGQQQRLAIARALYKQAPILIMDEATSALDAISEDQIKQALHQLKGSVTQIVIAHRLSTIEDADRIVFLEQGRKIAEGTKDELLETCAPFRHMWELMHRQENSDE